MPTEAELSRRYKVSRQTIRRAFVDLVTEGLVYRVPGRGTFTAEQNGEYIRHFGSVDDLMALSADSQMVVLQPLRDVVEPSAAGRLQLATDRVSALTFVRIHNNQPFCHTSVYLPPQFGARLSRIHELTETGISSTSTVLALLDSVLDSPVQDAEQSISVAKLPDEAAPDLSLPAGSPVLRIDRTYYDANGQAVELAINYYHPERYTYRIKLRRNRL